MVCFVPAPDGKPHMMHGMVKGLTVTQGTSTRGPAHAGHHRQDDRLHLRISDTVAAGHHVILFQNDGPQEHEAVFVKLEAGKTAEDFLKWAAKLAGPAPGTPINGRVR
jgi:hypothetical protein